MRIVIIGGHGQVALLTAPKLVKGGHKVLSVVRNEKHVEAVQKTGAEVVVADIEQLDVDGIVELVEGSDAVIWSAGAGGGDPERTRAVDREAAIRTIDAAVSAGVGRFVMVSYAGSGRDNVARDNPFRHYAEAKAAADAHLRDAKLNWTILGPGRLTDEQGMLHIEWGDKVRGGDTARENVAEVLYRTVGRSDLGGATINFEDGDVSINDAMESVARQLSGRPVAYLREGRPRRMSRPMLGAPSRR